MPPGITWGIPFPGRLPSPAGIFAYWAILHVACSIRHERLTDLGGVIPGIRPEVGVPIGVETSQSSRPGKSAAGVKPHPFRQSRLPTVEGGTLPGDTCTAEANASKVARDRVRHRPSDHRQ